MHVSLWLGTLWSLMTTSWRSGSDHHHSHASPTYEVWKLKLWPPLDPLGSNGSRDRGRAPLTMWSLYPLMQSQYRAAASLLRSAFCGKMLGSVKILPNVMQAACHRQLLAADSCCKKLVDTGINDVAKCRTQNAGLYEASLRNFEPELAGN